MQSSGTKYAEVGTRYAENDEESAAQFRELVGGWSM
jgi:hypothetical protein